MIVADDIAAWSGQPLSLVRCDLGTYYETASIDCGCPEALFSHKETGLYCIAHFEQDGEGEIFIEDIDGASEEHVFPAPSLDALVRQAVSIIEHKMEG